MKTTLKLEKIETLSGGVDVAHIDLELHFPYLEKTLNVKLRSTHHVLRLMSDHRISDLQLLMDWLNKSSDKKTLRTNDGEIILFAREMFKANKSLKEIRNI